MRTQTADWWPLPVPELLWLNTAALIAGSVALQWVKTMLRRGDTDDVPHGVVLDRVRAGLLAAGGLPMAFLGGQLLVWRELPAGGHLLAGAPAKTGRAPVRERGCQDGVHLVVCVTIKKKKE